MRQSKCWRSSKIYFHPCPMRQRGHGRRRRNKTCTQTQTHPQDKRSPGARAPRKEITKNQAMDHLTVQMSRLILRHEDALNRMKLDVGFALHIETSAPILASLLKVSRKWKGDKEAGKLTVDLPLKKMSTYPIESAEFKKLVTDNVITQDKFFFKNRWDPKDKKLNNTSQSMSMTELLPQAGGVRPVATCSLLGASLSRDEATCRALHRASRSVSCWSCLCVRITRRNRSTCLRRWRRRQSWT